jgi:hypothetical protein
MREFGNGETDSRRAADDNCALSVERDPMATAVP